MGSNVLIEKDQTKTLISALNFLSHNLPLSHDLFDSVLSVHGGSANYLVGDVGLDYEEEPLLNNSLVSTEGGVLNDFKDALDKNWPSHISGFELAAANENRFQSHIQHRLTELKEFPTSRGEDIQSMCLLELYGLKLSELQRKVRCDVFSEYMLQVNCASPDRQIFDWDMMKLCRPSYGTGKHIAVNFDYHLKEKRNAGRLLKLQEEENSVETKKRKFFAEILNALRELQLQFLSAQKRRKQQNDGVQAWHARQKQHATRQEKLRFQALKLEDPEAYMRLVEETKNERLSMLLGQTNDLLVCLGAAVRRQKDADGIEPLNGSEFELTKTPTNSHSDEDIALVVTKPGTEVKTGDFLEGQCQYNSVIHSVQEKVVEQPSMLEVGELRPYQLEGLQWVLSLFNNNLNGVLADEMGLGKTIQTIALIAYLMEKKGVAGPHLIVAPKAVLPNWINEFSTWAPSIGVVLYDGRRDERKALREDYSGSESFNVLLTHYDLIMRDKAFLKKTHWYYMIVDEGHRLKNSKCALAETLAGYRIRRRLLLTGTPIQNNLQELWALLNFLLPTIFDSVKNFQEWFNTPFDNGCAVSLTDAEESLVIRRLHRVIRPFILRRKKDEVEKSLPPKTRVILKCDMSAWQKVYYQQLTDFRRIGTDIGTGTSKSLQNLTMQFRKCSNHPYLFLDRYNFWQKDEIVRASGKFELLDSLLPKLHRAGHRLLIFSQMTQLMDILEVYFQLHEFKYLRLDGSTKTEERDTLVKHFNAPDSPFFIFLLSTHAGGLGLNLQTADTVIIFDIDWNPQMDQQAEDRVHRIGQTKDVRVFVLVSAGSIEEVMLDRAKQKMGIDAKVIQAGLFNKYYTAKDRKDILEEIMCNGASSLGTDVPSEREINRLAARSEEEFWLFENMDGERRQKEKYRCRLMEENEVPDWAYAKPDNPQDMKGKGFAYEIANLSGKRRRKEVVYACNEEEKKAAMEVENRSEHGSGFLSLEYQYVSDEMPSWNAHKRRRSTRPPYRI